MVKFAVICVSNNNRSMEAHCILQENGFEVKSYGTGTQVKLPGPAIDKPNVYDFGTPYDLIYQDLYNKDSELYAKTGILTMLDRNRRIKPAPQRFQDAADQFDVIICCEERCFDQVCEDLTNAGNEVGKAVHVINFDIKDNHEDAAVGAQQILLLCEMVRETDDLENTLDGILEKFYKKTGIPCLHTILFY